MSWRGINIFSSFSLYWISTQLEEKVTKARVIQSPQLKREGRTAESWLFMMGHERNCDGAAYWWIYSYSRGSWRGWPRGRIPKQKRPRAVYPRPYILIISFSRASAARTRSHVIDKCACIPAHSRYLRMYSCTRTFAISAHVIFPRDPSAVNQVLDRMIFMKKWSILLDSPLCHTGSFHMTCIQNRFVFWKVT